MDRIIEGYLTRFVSDLGLDKRDKEINFEKFCFYSILKNELNFLDDSDLDEISVDKNKGIDGICVSIDGNVIKKIFRHLKISVITKKTLKQQFILFKLKLHRNFQTAKLQIFAILL